ncbi:leucine-rich repeat-containing protein 15 [Solenopsis invicta]|uniref:leucine-rich repeat-containing protein 15 n=1 Tax=Solenopsis invicta TaxID=13686 RepID=UPI00193E0200|nr:leucine-rich repeat-containing protein 15 [Solenopsis invicta]
MAPGHKFIIFFLFTIIYLAKTEHNRHNTRDDPDLWTTQKTGGSVYRYPSYSPVTIPPHLPETDPTPRPYPRVTDSTPRPYYRVTNLTESPYNPPINCVRHDHDFSFINVGLQKIGPDFIKSTDTIRLSLNSNNISDISPSAFRNIKNLKYLDLSGNRIPKEKLLLLAKTENLQTLIINNNNDSHNPATDTMKEYNVFPNMKHLHLSSNQLRNFQVHFYLAMPYLTHLHLNNNSISSSDAVFENIPATLIQLHLNKNSIDRVKKDKLRSLQELSMDNNVITQVCFENCQDTSISLKGATEMQNLFLSKNLISEITLDAFTDTRSLSTLDLSGNKIADIAKGTFNNINYISNLSLANNILATVPDVCSIFYIVNLDLSGNRISAIHSDAFCAHLRNLEYLHLSNNVITTIEARAFRSLEKLKYLDLSGNRLRQLPAHWIYSSYVQELHLERNNFTNLDSISLIHIKTLSDVYLDENPMPILNTQSFQVLPGHLRVHLKNVRIQDECECQCENDNEDNDDDAEYKDENDARDDNKNDGDKSSYEKSSWSF